MVEGSRFRRVLLVSRDSPYTLYEWAERDPHPGKSSTGCVSGAKAHPLRFCCRLGWSLGRDAEGPAALYCHVYAPELLHNPIYSTTAR